LDEAKAFALANPDWDPTPSSDSSREDCGGTGPNTGCDDVCFSGLVDDECGLCNGDGVAAACGCTDTSGLNDEGCCDAVVKDCNDVCGGDWQEDCSEQCRSAFWFGLQGNGSCDGTGDYVDLSCYECDSGDCMLPCGCEDLDSCNDCCAVPNGDNSSCGSTGDVNDLAGVDVTDVVAIVADILETAALDECQANEADVTGDLTVNVLDVIAVVDIILSTEPCANYLVEVGGGSYDTEISWIFGGASGGAPSVTTVCLVSGDHIFTAIDSYGDGWNGATLNISNADGFPSIDYWGLTLSGGNTEDWTITLPGEFDLNVYGCTDTAACNYNLDATSDDGSCILVSDCNGVCGGG
jgi:hypothetical protein